VSDKLIVVIDTNILGSAALKPQSAIASILFDLGDLYILAFSSGVRGEIDEVLHRPTLCCRRNKPNSAINNPAITPCSSAGSFSIIVP
jgi:predicted nucleic acid-binding protein